MLENARLILEDFPDGRRVELPQFRKFARFEVLFERIGVDRHTSGAVVPEGTRSMSFHRGRTVRTNPLFRVAEIRMAGD